ncbi:Mpo1-like protein [Paenibacillus alginolyticus]|uniref:Mpo1-like protein n=1 Tax=Paenibacillus alginolyticus TaxID=59839 RepID=UPI0022851561|nr:Mpo1-like protein [Paenibacillus alginolyticus]
MRSDLKYYLTEHQNKYNRILHYFAFLSAFIAWIYLFIDLRVTITCNDTLFVILDRALLF